ncbi:MAG: threonine/serine exporter family protein, partial [Planctomycetaceae bacterium]|nr:threonine/serine exporter family protein [Planctomycetaceae bacterium]
MSGEAPPPKPDEPRDLGPVLEFMYRLGQAYLACGEQTAKVELLLRRVASAYGIRRTRVVAFPTALFITVHDRTEERITLAEGPTQVLRLDQIAAVYHLGDAAQRGEVTPPDGLEQLNVILRTPARFGAMGVIIGHAILTIGLAMLLLPSRDNLITAAVLGTIVGALKVFNRNRPVLAVPLPVVAAAIVSVLVFLAAKYGLPVDPLHALVPPLVSFLPGGMLTLGMVELAYGDMVSGSSRLITGFVQLVLLALGLAAGAVVVGYLPENLIDASPDQLDRWWIEFASWAGVVIFGVGAYIHFSAPQRSLGWMLLVLLL